MGWGNSQRRRGAAPRRYKLPPPGPGFLIRQTGIAYGDGRPDVEQDTIPTRVRAYSLDSESLEETTIDLTPRKQEDTIAVRVDGHLRAWPSWNVASTSPSAAACGTTVPLPPGRSRG
jgi:hypothetical protein